VKIPDDLSWWREEEGGAEWLASLPTLVADCAEQWSLELGEPFEQSHVSLVVPVTLLDARPAVLKVNFPDDESEHEATALRHWHGRGAVLLLEEDEARRALLVERCMPGTQLWSVESDEDATRIAASVLRELWRPAPDPSAYRQLREEAARWAVELPRHWEALGRPFERRLLDEATTACTELGADQGSPVVLHQDFHGGNVLRAKREPWLAIDPKPLLGEREFDAASLVRDRRWELGGPGDLRRMRRRLDVLAEELAVDRERMRRWGIAHALAWGVSGRKLEPDMVECARLLIEARPSS
jgi:streptomycin 6-kinase